MLAQALMETDEAVLHGAERHERTNNRRGDRNRSRVRTLDTRVGTSRSGLSQLGFVAWFATDGGGRMSPAPSASRYLAPWVIPAFAASRRAISSASNRYAT